MKVIDLKGTFAVEFWFGEGETNVMELSVVAENIAYFQPDTATTTFIQFVGVDKVFTAQINSKDLKFLIES